MAFDLAGLASLLPKHRVLRVDAQAPYASRPDRERYYCRLCAITFDRSGLDASAQHVHVSADEWPSLECARCGGLSWSPLVGAEVCEYCSQ